jgi:predicted Zn-dependent peptidase
MKTTKFLLLALCLSIGLHASAQGLKAFKLPNGLSVFVWEDESVADVFGMLAVEVGSKEDPDNYTGLAHYLEHLLFNGTEKIGSLDWEKEKPLYEQIIAKYDEHAQTADPKLREALQKEINRLTVESANFYLSKDFSTLIQGIGGESLNAGTSYDYTVYYNSFPPGEIYKWIELYSERLINPVFRNFQPELETVYEEYNMYQDAQSSRERDFIFNTLFPGHPYSRSIIGRPEHLKSPQLSRLIEFFNQWYVPGNMALILVGNIQTATVLPIIKEKFGRLEPRPTPERRTWPDSRPKGRKEVSAKLSNYPQAMLAFPGITGDSPDDVALEICISLLSNTSSTGLLDKLVLDGDALDGSAQLLTLKDRGHILLTLVPPYDVGQRRFESLKSAERSLLRAVDKLRTGQFDSQLVESIKAQMIRRYDLSMESPVQRAYRIAEICLAGRDMADLLQIRERIEAVDAQQIQAIAQHYFGPDYYALHLNEGKPPKGQTLEKPKFDPILPPRDAETDYSKAFRLLPVKLQNRFADLSTVAIRPVNDRSKLFYTPNKENDIFTLVLKYGVGTRKMPKLELATPLVNNAGIMGQMDAQAVKQAFSDLGATCRYQVDDNYLYVIMEGFEDHIEEACRLMTRQILLPQLDAKQMNSLLSSQLQSRKIEKTSNDALKNALREYLLYGKSSDYIDRLPMTDILRLTVSELTGEFQRATDYEVEIHYAGARPLDDVYDILSRNLPLKEGEKATTSPEARPRVSYEENTVFFLPNPDAQQSAIYFFIEGDAYDRHQKPTVDAFNQYFGGGFNGLVVQEIREYRSMAYTASGRYSTPALEGRPAYFIGSIGTQADKTLEAIEVYHQLLTDMPHYPDRIRDIKEYLRETASVEEPHFRDASQYFEAWKRLGYELSPAATHRLAVDALTFDDIVDFYHRRVRGRPLAIAVVGNPKHIDERALARYGRLVRLSTDRVINDK